MVELIGLVILNLVLGFALLGISDQMMNSVFNFILTLILVACLIISMFVLSFHSNITRGLRWI